MPKWKANLRVEPRGDMKAQWLSEEDESLEELKARMKKEGSNPSLYNFTQV
jgi:hypothetical protein